MKTKIALFLGLLLTANVSFADLKIGFVNIPAVPEKEKLKSAWNKNFHLVISNWLLNKKKSKA
jgi:outer membrane protein